MFGIKYYRCKGKDLNKLNKNQPFYKVINEHKKYVDHQYEYRFKLGLNIDTDKLSYGQHSRGGFYFTTKEHIIKHFSSGLFCCEIKIPDNAECFINDDIIKSNKIIICDFKLQSEIDGWYDADFCIYAIKQNSCIISLIKNFTDKTLLEVVKHSGHALDFIEQTNKFYKEAVKYHGYALEFVDIAKQTNEMCLDAVTQDGDNLLFVENQTEEICLAAVANYGISLKHVYVEEQTEAIYLAAVTQNGLALDYVHGEQTEEVCLAAVMQNGLALQFVKNKTEKICLAAVLQNIAALKYVDNITEEIRWLSVMKNDYDTTCVGAFYENNTKYVEYCEKYKKIFELYEARFKSYIENNNFLVLV
jgi:hypothetical protein